MTIVNKYFIEYSKIIISLHKHVSNHHHHHNYKNTVLDIDLANKNNYNIVAMY